MTVEMTLSTDGRWDLGMTLPCGHFLMQRLSWCTARSGLVTHAADAELTVARLFCSHEDIWESHFCLVAQLVSPPPEQRGVLPQLIPENDRFLSLLLFSLFLSCSLCLGRASLRK